MLRQRYSTLRLTKHNFNAQNGIAQIQTIYDEVYNDLQAMQEEYDSMTAHGTNKTAQRVWEIKIREKLEELSGFQRKD